MRHHASPTNWFSQIVSVTRFGLQTIPQRKGSALAAAFGIAGVVAVMVGVLSIGQGFRRTMTATGSPDVALVLRSGADNEMMSNLAGDETRVIADAPGIARSSEGALVSAECFAVINLDKKSTGTDANVPLRGVQPPAFQVRDEIKMVAGRKFEPGRNEIIAGRAAAGEFKGLDLHSTIKVGRTLWTVVGIFSAANGISESEIWTDVAVLQGAYQRGNTFQAVYAKLQSPEAFQTFKDALTTDPRLKVKVVRQTEYYADQSTLLYNLINVLGGLVAALMGIGAIFGALNTMYTAVAARTREIATLRALGFGRGPVVVSVLVESTVLAVVGGTVGALLAYVAFDGFQTATINWQSFSQVAFAFAVTPALLVLGIGCAVVIGLFGGLFPAVRAARLPIARALRDL